MTIGTGIAIAGVWIFAAAAVVSRNVTSKGMWIAMIIASVVTWNLA